MPNWFSTGLAWPVISACLMLWLIIMANVRLHLPRASTRSIGMQMQFRAMEIASTFVGLSLCLVTAWALDEAATRWSSALRATRPRGPVQYLEMLATTDIGAPAAALGLALTLTVLARWHRSALCRLRYLTFRRGIRIILGRAGIAATALIGLAVITNPGLA